MRTPRAGISIKPISRRYHGDGFHCGKQDFNQYLQAALSSTRRTERIYVALDESKSIVGFYALSACSIEFDDEDYTQGILHPYFAARIMVLAVDRCMTDQGIARLLLGHALHMIYNVVADNQLDIDIVLCDTPDTRAKAFYLHYGFIALPGMQKAVFLPLRSLDKLIQPLAC